MPCKYRAEKREAEERKDRHGDPPRAVVAVIEQQCERERKTKAVAHVKQSPHRRAPRFFAAAARERHGAPDQRERARVTRKRPFRRLESAEQDRERHRDLVQKPLHKAEAEREEP